MSTITHDYSLRTLPLNPQPIATTNQSFTIEQIPRILADRQIGRIYMEILNEGEVVETGDPDFDESREGLNKNHVLLRVLFRSEMRQATAVTPARTCGVRISMGLDRNAPAYAQDEFGGTLRISTIRYHVASLNALKVVHIGLNRPMTLWSFLAPIRNLNMADFRFVTTIGYMGCRDWILQVIRQLEIRNMVNPSYEQESAYQVLLWRYNENRPRVRHDVDKGRFTNYTRIPIPNHAYLA